LAESESKHDKKQVITYTYDQAENLSTRIKTVNDKETQTDIYQYDSRGNLTDKCIGVYEHFSVDDSDIRCSSVENCQFNNNDQKIRCSFYDSKSSSEVPLFETYHYDNFGNLIETETKTETANYISSQYHFDNYGNKIKEIHLDESGTMIETKLYTFDIKNKLILYQHLDHDANLITQEHYTYNNKGNKTKWYTTDASGKTKTKEIYKYNRANKMIKKISKKYISNNKTTSKSLYFYDRLGDWIKKIEYIDKKPITITERKIQYF